MTPVPEQTPLQTKEVEYYRAAPSAPGTHSVDLERVHPVVRPTRSPSDPPAVAPLSIGKRVRSPPAAIMVPSSSTRLEIVRPQRSPARQTGHFDADAPPSSSHVSAETHAPPSSYLAPRSQSNRGPAPGPPPQGPLPPLPDQEPPFSAVDPLVLRAVSARERRETRRQSKTPDDKDKEIAALERSMRRLSRISLVTGSTSPAGDTSGPTSPTISLAGSLSRGESQVGRLERTEKLLRRISRQSDGVRLPSDYGRVGISGYSVPASAPVSPGIRGVSSPLRPHKSETEASELAYLVDERPSPALSVPMRRNVDHRSAHAAYTPAISEPIHGLGLGLTLTPSDSMSSSMASTSMSSLPSTTSMSTLPSESTIRPTLETRSSRLGSLSSASSTAASIHSAQTFETASTTSLLTPVSPPTQTTPLPKPSRSPMSPPRQLKLKATIRLPSPAPLPSRPASPDVPSILAQFRETPTLPVPLPEVSAVPATRIRPGARPRVHSDLAPLDIPPPVPPKDGAPEHAESNRSSTDSRVAVEDSPADIYRANEDSNVLEVPPMRQSLESQATPRVAHVSRSSAPTPTPKAAQNPSRPASPDIPYLLRNTPRPVRRGSQHSLASSLAGSHRTVGTTAAAPPSSFRPTPGLAGPSRRGSEMSIASSRRSSSAVTASSAGFDVQGAGPEYFFGEQYDSEDSDSDLDLSTPLPHMMLRAGLLSPRSTIITELVEPAQPAPSGSGLSARGEALRLKGEKVWKAESKRKIRHRDGRNLRDGVGLTTGLGWSDSEDEDAPSPLRRRLSSVLLAKAQAQSRPPSQLSRQTPLTLSRRSTYSNLDSTSVSSQSLPRTPASHPLSLPLTPSSLPGAASGADEFGKLDFPLPPTATSRRPLPSPGLKRIPSSTMMRSASNPAPPAVPPTPSSLRTRTTSNVSSTTSAGGLRTPARSKMPMPVPTPRQSKVNMRSPSGTRLSAPEALRQTDRVVTDGSRRLSGA